MLEPPRAAPRLEYDFVDNQDADADLMDRMLGFFPGDPMMVSVRTNLAVQQFNKVLGKGKTWKDDLDDAKKKADISKEHDTTEQFPWNDIDSLDTMRKVRGVQGRIADMQSFLSLIQGTLTTDPNVGVCNVFKDSVEALANTSKAISNGVAGIFEIKKDVGITEKDLKDARQPYAQQLNDVLKAVGALVSTLKATYGDADNQLLSLTVKKNLESVGLLNPTGEWVFEGEDVNSKIWIRKVVGQHGRPEDTILDIDPDKNPLDHSEGSGVNIYNNFDSVRDGGEFIPVETVKIGINKTEDELKDFSNQVKNAVTILKFVSGEANRRAPEKAGLIQRLLNQRAALAQSTAKIALSINSRYAAMTKVVKASAKAMKKYERGKGSPPDGQTSMTLKSLREKFEEGEVITKKGEEDSYQWPWRGGEEGNTWRVDARWPHNKNPFPELMEIDYESITKENPESIKKAIKVITKAYWDSIRMQHAMADIISFKIQRMRLGIKKLYNTNIVRNGLSERVKTVTQDDVEIQLVLQQAGPDVFSLDWQSKTVRDNEGTLRRILNREVEEVLPAQKIEAIYSMIPPADTLLAPINVENLLQGLLIDAVEPVMKSFVTVFGRFNETNRTLYELLASILKLDGINSINRIKNEYRALKQTSSRPPINRLDPDLVGKILGTVSGTDGFANLEETKFSELSLLEDTEMFSKVDTFQTGLNIGEMASQINAIYVNIHHDIISGYKVLNACMTDGQRVILSPKFIESLGEVEEGEAVGVLETPADIYRTIAQRVLFETFAADRTMTMFTYDNSEGVEEAVSKLDEILFPEISSEKGKEPEEKEEKIDPKKGFDHVWDTVFAGNTVELGTKAREQNERALENVATYNSIDKVSNLVGRIVETQSRQRKRAIEEMVRLYNEEKKCRDARGDAEKKESEAFEAQKKAETDLEEAKKEHSEAISKIDIEVSEASDRVVESLDEFRLSGIAKAKERRVPASNVADALKELKTAETLIRKNGREFIKEKEELLDINKDLESESKEDKRTIKAQNSMLVTKDETIQECKKEKAEFRTAKRQAEAAKSTAETNVTAAEKRERDVRLLLFEAKTKASSCESEKARIISTAKEKIERVDEEKKVLETRAKEAEERKEEISVLLNGLREQMDERTGNVDAANTKATEAENKVNRLEERIDKELVPVSTFKSLANSFSEVMQQIVNQNALIARNTGINMGLGKSIQVHILLESDSRKTVEDWLTRSNVYRSEARSAIVNMVDTLSKTIEIRTKENTNLSEILDNFGAMTKEIDGVVSQVLSQNAAVPKIIDGPFDSQDAIKEAIVPFHTLPRQTRTVQLWVSTMRDTVTNLAQSIRVINGALQNRIESLGVERTTNKARIKELETLIDESTVRIGKLNTQAETLKGEVEAAKQKGKTEGLEESAATILKLEKDIETLNGQMAKMRGQRKALQADNESLTTAKNELMVRTSSTEFVTSQLSKRFNTLQVQFDLIQDTLEEKKQEIVKLTNDLEIERERESILPFVISITKQLWTRLDLDGSLKYVTRLVSKEPLFKFWMSEVLNASALPPELVTAVEKRLNLSLDRNVFPVFPDDLKENFEDADIAQRILGLLSSQVALLAALPVIQAQESFVKVTEGSEQQLEKAKGFTYVQDLVNTVWRLPFYNPIDTDTVVFEEFPKNQIAETRDSGEEVKATAMETSNELRATLAFLGGQITSDPLGTQNPTYKKFVDHLIVSSKDIPSDVRNTIREYTERQFPDDLGKKIQSDNNIDQFQGVIAGVAAMGAAIPALSAQIIALRKQLKIKHRPPRPSLELPGREKHKRRKPLERESTPLGSPSLLTLASIRLLPNGFIDFSDNYNVEERKGPRIEEIETNIQGNVPFDGLERQASSDDDENNDTWNMWLS